MFWMRLIVINKLTALVFNELNGCVCCFLTRHVNSCFFGGSFNIFNKKMIKKTTVLHIYVNSLYIVSFRNGSPSPFLFQFEKQINVYIKWSALSSSGAPCHEYKRSVIHQALFLSEEPLVHEASQTMDAVLHLNSAFIGSFICYINLPFTSSVQTPRGSSRFFSVLSSFSNLAEERSSISCSYWAAADGIYNGQLYLHMEVR